MNLRELFIFHFEKDGPSSQPPRFYSDLISHPKLLNLGFPIETCQRFIFVGRQTGEISGGFRFSEWVESLGLGTEVECLHGKQAYQFLLEFCCGLKSQVIGETDVFGQFKAAWMQEPYRSRVDVLEMRSWLERLLEDTKDIRSRYLHNLGGSSYGTLVRRIFRSQKVSEGPVLVFGAGKMAQSLVPFFQESEVWIANRSLPRLNEFLDWYQDSFKKDNLKLLSTQDFRENLKAASRVLICVPGEFSRDEAFLQSYLAGGVAGRSVIHLGVSRKDAGRWIEIPGFFTLSDLYEIQESMAEVRQTQIEFARKASFDRAQLRSMNTSLSICHGWEDLACFA